MLNIIIATLATAGLQQRVMSPRTFVGTDYKPVHLFTVYIRENGHSAGMFVGTQVSVMFSGEDKDWDWEVAGFRKEFLYDLVNRDPVGRITDLIPQTVMSLETPLRVDQLRAKFEPGSLVDQALNNFITRKVTPKKDQIREFHYAVRPWLTGKGKRTEAVMGELLFTGSYKWSKVSLFYVRP